METHLADWIKGTPDGIEAESILRACVHCGFCNATCPTYQLLGDELDGPRGRIYQIKQMLEGAPPPGRSPIASKAMDGRERPGQSTQLHLDRCLTCMNCETTCPSGVRYGRLVDIGRATVEQRVPRSPAQRWRRTLLRRFVTTGWLFAPAVRLGRLLRPLLPASLRNELPPARAAGDVPRRSHARKVLLLNGCVQPALMPAIDAATARVLDALGIEAIIEPRSGCCGAVDFHLTATEAAKAAARRNIDAWWPHIVRGAEAIVINASGCGAMVKDYEHLLHSEPAYAVKALRVVALTLDLAELLAPMQQALISTCSQPESPASPRRVAFHPPCTLQHTQKIRGAVEGILAGLGAELVPVGDAHLCCGSAGSYSLLQPALSQQLRERKLENLERGKPQMILSANIGCLNHLETGTAIPMRHWIEWVDGRLPR
ncbi:MAG TPA: glycolate oxidase subunit GlcF [Rhodanobacteraceae bacterium]|jgi:glycolate oxidase iron-sulfur subunit|nr:glycolate oxidase subunit GlcF [Rhodanobacteraceae bacterium]